MLWSVIPHARECTYIPACVHCLQGISDIITVAGLINVDFADVKSILSNSGTAMLGVGCAAGPDRAEQAAYAAVSAPLIQQSVERATGDCART